MAYSGPKNTFNIVACKQKRLLLLKYIPRKCYELRNDPFYFPMLATIGSGLLSKDVAPIELTAVVEGTIATVFQHLKNEIVFEIDTPEIGTQWREQVVAARQEAEGLEIPKPQCDDMKEWEIEVEELSGRILWDADYKNAGLYIDHPPEKSKWLKDMSGVSDNYFLAIADDLTEEQAKAHIVELQKLCQSIAGVQ